MRNAFIQELVALAQANDHVALVVGDLGYSVIEPFADRFPDRFINAGVAEQNMTGLAAGMASEGYHVFTYSIANFPTFRCAEQIRNDVDYHGLPVTIVSVGGGLAYGSLGYSHHAVQDYALMRCFPSTLIAAPGDPLEVRACLRYLVKHPGPSYLRLGKAGEPAFHSFVPDITPGQWLAVAPAVGGQNNAVLTTGATLAMAMEWRERGPYAGYAVCSMPLWGMSNKRLQAAQVERIARLVTVEDHLIDGGFGSWMLEALAQSPQLRARINAIGLSEAVCGTVGSQAELNSVGGLRPRD
jgi:transketolase